MANHDAFLAALMHHQPLDMEEMIAFWHQVDCGEHSPQMIVAVLSVMSSQTPSMNLVLSFLHYVQQAYPKTRLPSALTAVNIVGTGGGINTFNISTTAAFVTAAAGVPVLKSGSRAYSSRSGSQDVLDRLGIRVPGNDAVLEEMIQTLGIGFAPVARYPALCRKLALACQPLSFRLVGQFINRLGPLLCPFELKGQVTGVSNPELMNVLACATHELTQDNILFVHAGVGADELLPTGHNVCWWVQHKEDRQWNDTFGQAGKEASTATLRALAGGSPSENAARLQRVLAGDDEAEALEAVALNAGAALLVAGRVDSLSKGISLARRILHSGEGLGVLQRTQHFCRQLRERA